MRIKNLPSIESMDGSQDALVIEQTDGSEDKSRKVSPAQIKQYVLGNSIDDIYSVMGQMGAKNLLVPEWVETKTIENGVTYTFNADGTIIMNTDENGATANTNCNLRQNTVTTNNVFPAGTYTLTACPAGGSSTTYRTWARAYRPGTTTALTSNLYDEGNGVSFTVSEPFSLGLNVTVMKGYVCNNLTWKPMLRYASDTDNTYQPYAKTNKQLTEDKAEVVSVRDYVNELGVKNLIPYPYVNKSQTINNVEFTVNGDGSISADNAASAITQFRLYGWTTGLSPLLLRKGTYILSGCPSGGGINSLRLYLHNQDSSFSVIDEGEGTQFTLSDDTYVGIAIRVANGYDADGKTIYPMLRLAADINDDTYVPFAMTNKQLTDGLDTAREQIAALENIKVANVSATMNVATADSKAIGGHRSTSSTSKALSTFTGYPTGKTVVATSLFAYGENAAILGVVNVINGVVYLNTAATGNYTVHGNVFYKD